MYENKAFLKGASGFFGNFLFVQYSVIGEEATRAYAELRISFLGPRSFDQFHAWPDTSGVLPSTAGTT